MLASVAVVTGTVITGTVVAGIWSVLDFIFDSPGFDRKSFVLRVYKTAILLLKVFDLENLSAAFYHLKWETPCCCFCSCSNLYQFTKMEAVVKLEVFWESLVQAQTHFPNIQKNDNRKSLLFVKTSIILSVNY